MKLSKHIVFNILLSTVVFSTFANGKFDGLKGAQEWIVGHQRDVTISASSAAAGALLVYLATNKTVKHYTGKTAGTVSDYTKAKYQAFVNYWKSLSKGKKTAALATAGAGITAAYIYFEGPGVGFVKDKLNTSKKSAK